jgi:hypothetical protein
MRVVKITVVLISLLLSIMRCSTDRCFKDVGDVEEYEIFFDTLHTVNIWGLFDVELIQDTVFKLVALAPEQVMEGLEFMKSNDTLDCYNYNNCFWRRDLGRPKVKLHSAGIRNINLMESCFLYSTDSIRGILQISTRTEISEVDLILSTRYFSFYNNKTCGGAFRFAGKSDYTTIAGYNTAISNAKNLYSKRATIRNYSAIDMSINVQHKLTAWIFNSGNIYYSGQPEVIIDSITGSGKLIHVD